MKHFESKLEQHPFLKWIHSPYLKTSQNCSSYIEFEPGEFIFRQGENANQFYLILDGTVDVELFSASGGPVVLQKIRKGEVLGWSWLVAPYLWRFDVRAVEATKLAVLDGTELRAKMEENHNFGFDLLQRFVAVIIERLESARLELIAIHAAHT